MRKNHNKMYSRSQRMLDSIDANKTSQQNNKPDDSPERMVVIPPTPEKEDSILETPIRGLLKFARVNIQMSVTRNMELSFKNCETSTPSTRTYQLKGLSSRKKALTKSAKLARPGQLPKPKRNICMQLDDVDQHVDADHQTKSPLRHTDYARHSMSISPVYSYIHEDGSNEVPNQNECDQMELTNAVNEATNIESATLEPEVPEICPLRKKCDTNYMTQMMSMTFSNLCINETEYDDETLQNTAVENGTVATLTEENNHSICANDEILQVDAVSSTLTSSSPTHCHTNHDRHSMSISPTDMNNKSCDNVMHNVEHISVNEPNTVFQEEPDNKAGDDPLFMANNSIQVDADLESSDHYSCHSISFSLSSEFYLSDKVVEVPETPSAESKTTKNTQEDANRESESDEISSSRENSPIMERLVKSSLTNNTHTDAHSESESSSRENSPIMERPVESSPTNRTHRDANSESESEEISPNRENSPTNSSSVVTPQPIKSKTPQISSSFREVLGLPHSPLKIVKLFINTAAVVTSDSPNSEDPEAIVDLTISDCEDLQPNELPARVEESEIKAMSSKYSLRRRDELKPPKRVRDGAINKKRLTKMAAAVASSNNITLKIPDIPSKTTKRNTRRLQVPSASEAESEEPVVSPPILENVSTGDSEEIQVAEKGQSTRSKSKTSRITANQVPFSSDTDCSSSNVPDISSKTAKRSKRRVVPSASEAESEEPVVSPPTQAFLENVPTADCEDTQEAKNGHSTRSKSKKMPFSSDTDCSSSNIPKIPLKKAKRSTRRDIPSLLEAESVESVFAPPIQTILENIPPAASEDIPVAKNGHSTRSKSKTLRITNSDTDCSSSNILDISSKRAIRNTRSKAPRVLNTASLSLPATIFENVPTETSKDDTHSENSKSTTISTRSKSKNLPIPAIQVTLSSDTDCSNSNIPDIPSKKAKKSRRNEALSVLENESVERVLSPHMQTIPENVPTETSKDDTQSGNSKSTRISTRSKFKSLRIPAIQVTLSSDTDCSNSNIPDIPSKKAKRSRRNEALSVLENESVERVLSPHMQIIPENVPTAASEDIQVAENSRNTTKISTRSKSKHSRVLPISSSDTDCSSSNNLDVSSQKSKRINRSQNAVPVPPPSMQTILEQGPTIPSNNIAITKNVITTRSRTKKVHATSAVDLQLSTDIDCSSAEDLRSKTLQPFNFPKDYVPTIEDYKVPEIGKAAFNKPKRNTTIAASSNLRRSKRGPHPMRTIHGEIIPIKYDLTYDLRWALEFIKNMPQGQNPFCATKQNKSQNKSRNTMAVKKF